MAMIDYGAIVIKNGEVINHNLFEDMDVSVGWNDEDYLYYKKDYELHFYYLNGNYYAYVGDKNFTIAFYKNYCRISWLNNHDYIYVDNSSNNYKSHKYIICGNTFCLKEICPRVTLCIFDYNGDRYRVIFGYGIDPDFNIWNKTKIKYLGKNNASKVDKAIKKYINY